MIRVLQMIGSLNIGGSQAMILNLYEAIDRTKVQFDFILDEPTQRELADRVTQLGGKIYEMPKFTGKNYFEVKRAWKSFFTEHPEYKILHSHVRSYASIYFPIARKYGVTTIIHSHSTSNGTGVKAFAKAILQWPIRYIADYLFACSATSGEWLFGKNVTERENFRVIPNCIDISRFLFSQEKRDYVRKMLRIAPDDFVVGHVGRFHPAKNHRFLVDIFAEICSKDARAKLLLIGDGELMDDIRSYCEERNVIDKVLFAGSQKDVSPFYSAMDVFVFPSLWEGVPVSVVEAQAAGLHCYVSEQVTRDVCVSGLVHYLSIDRIVDWWVESIVSTDLRRIDVQSEIREAGYEATSSAAFLCQYYEAML